VYKVEFEFSIEKREYQNITTLEISEEELACIDNNFFPDSLKMAMYRIGAKALKVEQGIFICKTDKGFD
jgi:hypothetical protein